MKNINDFPDYITLLYKLVESFLFFIYIRPAPKLNMASSKKKPKKDFLDRLIDLFHGTDKQKKPYKLATAGVVSAITAALIKAEVLTKTFPEPWNTYANAILFLAILAMAVDFMRTGLLD